MIQRLGRGAVLEQALRDSLPEWYERALLDSGVNPVGDPSIEVTVAPENEGQPLGFKFEVGVRPTAELGEYTGLEVGKAEPEVPDDIIDREIERIRGGMARLEPVERAAAEGMCCSSTSADRSTASSSRAARQATTCSSSATSQLIEGFEEQLTGAERGRQP